MSAVRVVVVQVEGSVEDVVQVCERLRLCLPPTPEMAAVAPTAQAQDKWGPPAQPSYAPPSGPGSVRAQRVAAEQAELGARDVVVPPHPSTTPRPKQQLLGDLAAVIPEVGDTVKVADFCRDDSERTRLRDFIDKFNRDERFRWVRGQAGGARPARIRREKP